MRMQNLKVAVTGGAGFIGSHLSDQLAVNNSVVVIDNFATGKKENLASSPQIKILEGDVRDTQTLEKAFEGIDVVFHLATHCVRLSLSDPRTNHEVNATGTLNALMAAQKNKVSRFVYCSSSEVYGNTQSGLLSEDSPKIPTTVYGASKLVGEYYALAFHQTYGLNAMVVRPFNTYGPRSHLFGPYGEVIPRFTMMMRGGEAPVIFGDGKQTRDFTYVEDTARGLIAAGECDGLLGESVNLAHGKEVTVLDLAQTLSRIQNIPCQPKFIEDRPGDIRRLGANVAKAQEIVRFTAEVSIEEGLKRYLKWLDTFHYNYKDLVKRLKEKNWE